MATLPADRVAARLQLVDEHLRLENDHNLDGIMGTFGANPRYDNEPMDEHYVGRAAVRGFYAEILRAMPDLAIEVKRRYVSSDAIIVEVHIRGTHIGSWRGLPGTGRRIRYPLCGIYTFDEGDRLASERIYYDRATVYGQLGIFREPSSPWGRLVTVVTHPVTVARACWRTLRATWAPGARRQRRGGGA